MSCKLLIESTGCAAISGVSAGICSLPKETLNGMLIIQVMDTVFGAVFQLLPGCHTRQF